MELHLAEAARLMGLEVVEDHIGEATEMVLPRICEVMGVEVGERFGDGVFEYEITPDNKMMWFSNCGRGESTAKSLIEIINHPDRIIRKPRFTEEEVAQAEAVKILFGMGASIYREDPGLLYVRNAPANYHIPIGLFPSLRPGQAVRLEEVVM